MVDPPAWDILDEDWDNLVAWSTSGTTTEISPAGQLHQIETNNGSLTICNKNQTIPTEATYETYMIADNLGPWNGALGNSDNVFLKAGRNGGEMSICLTSDKVVYKNNAGAYIPIAYAVGGLGWFRMRCLLEIGGTDKISIYVKPDSTGLWVALVEEAGMSGSNQTKTEFFAYKAASVTNPEHHTTWTGIATGLYDPTEVVGGASYGPGGISATISGGARPMWGKKQVYG
jgi:hypothetical protein